MLDISASDPPPSDAAVVTTTTAVVPAAGLGTRLRPLTSRIPKELLPIAGKLALEHILIELLHARMRRIVIVVSPAKHTQVRAVFGTEYGDMEILYAVQTDMRGLGHAVLCAEPLVAEPSFVVALGDAIFQEPETGGVTRRLMRACLDANASSGLIVQRVPRDKISKYGVVRPSAAAANADGTASPFVITDIIEKPTPADAPSEYAAAARYLLPATIFQTLQATKPGVGGEIQLTDALRAHLQRGETGIAVPLQAGETRHDIGGLDTYYRAFVAFALADPTHGESLRAYLSERLYPHATSLVPQPTTAMKPPIPAATGFDSSYSNKEPS